jgi:small-conductance mechanosensitive channel
MTAEQARVVLDVLRDDARRTQFLTVLEGLAKALPAAASAAAPSASPGAAPLSAPPLSAPPVAAAPVPAQLQVQVPAVAGGAAQVLVPVIVPVQATTPLAATTPPAAKPAASPAVQLPIPLQPDSLGADLLVSASDRLSSLSAQLADTTRAVTDFPLFSRWVIHIASDPDARQEVLDTAWKLFVVLLASLAAERVAVRLLTRPLARLAASAPEADGIPPDHEAIAEAEAGQTENHRRRPAAMLLLRRSPFVAGRFLLSLLPILAFAAASYALLGTRLGGVSTTRLVILAVVHAYILGRLVVTFTRAVVSPDLPRLRLLHMQDGMAQYVVRWVQRIAVTGICGYAMAEVGLLFGLYRVAHDAMLKLVVLAVLAMLTVVVLQQRRPVSDFLRGRAGGTGVVARMRSRAAAVWHIVAIFYLAALWLVWAFNVPDGFARLVWIFVVTAVILVSARLANVAAMSALDRVFSLDAGLSARYPSLEGRSRRYHPLLRAVVSATIIAMAVVILFQAWGLDSLAWFASGALGERLVSALITIGVTVLMSLLAWEGANAAAQHHLEVLSRDDQAARAARLRTLLPMFRTTLMVSIALIAGLTVLSEIGVNIAPLLAGAGVLGIAIGFGSQKLVQDIITGLFLLLENTMQVGDVVTLGGLTGSVENLSIRTIRLRALDGSVHIVPFSAVTTVTNMTRDFGYAVIDIAVGLNEEPERIGGIIREITDRMRGEPGWASAIRDDIEIMGIEKFVDFAYILRARVMTLPGQRWAVVRELHQRIKHRFDELGIESPITSTRVLRMPTILTPLIRRDMAEG